MTDRELMQQALDALEEINKLSIGENAICLPAEIDGAMDALRERLAQPEQAEIVQRAEAAYAAAKKREWQGLTDEQLETMAEKYVTNCYFDTLKFARAIEARLKEKNDVSRKLETG